MKKAPGWGRVPAAQPATPHSLPAPILHTILWATASLSVGKTGSFGLQRTPSCHSGVGPCVLAPPTSPQAREQGPTHQQYSSSHLKADFLSCAERCPCAQTLGFSRASHTPQAEATLEPEGLLCSYPKAQDQSAQQVGRIHPDTVSTSRPGTAVKDNNTSLTYTLS